MGVTVWPRMTELLDTDILPTTLGYLTMKGHKEYHLFCVSHINIILFTIQLKIIPFQLHLTCFEGKSLSLLVLYLVKCFSNGLPQKSIILKFSIKQFQTTNLNVKQATFTYGDAKIERIYEIKSFHHCSWHLNVTIYVGRKLGQK